jgi:hypothetical protein
MSASNFTRTFLLPYLNRVTLADHNNGPWHVKSVFTATERPPPAIPAKRRKAPQE